MAKVVLVLTLVCVGCASGGGSRGRPGSAPVASAPQVPSIQVLYESGDDQQVVGRAAAAPDAVVPENAWFAVHSYLRLGQQDEAMRALGQLSEVGDPAWQTAAQLLRATLSGDTAALERARGAASGYPNHPYVQYELGTALVAQRDFAAAARAFDASTAADPAFSYAYYQAALAYEQLNRNDLVVIRLDMFVRLAPNAPERQRAEAILRTVRGL
jgi:tetratricopeptide (TPR) repeat protein